MVPDRIIPGTLNVGHTLPTVAQAFIYTKLIPVDVLTLFSMITAAILGAWLGAGVVCHWPKRKVQIGMGVGAARRRDADADHPGAGDDRQSDPSARRRGAWASAASPWSWRSPATSCWAR